MFYQMFFQAKLYAYTLILLRDMLGKTSWYSTDVNGNYSNILPFYKKFHSCHLLAFATVGQIWLFENQFLSAAKTCFM